jgi:hypothetical protein
MTGMTMVDSHPGIPDVTMAHMEDEWKLEQDMSPSFLDPFEMDKLQ